MNNMETAQLLASLVDEKRGQLRDIEVMACMDYIMGGIYEDTSDSDGEDNTPSSGEEETNHQTTGDIHIPFLGDDEINALSREELRDIEHLTHLFGNIRFSQRIRLRFVKDDPIQNLSEFNRYARFACLEQRLERSQSQ